MIKFTCSKCGRKISVDDKYAGKKGKCPGCGQAAVVPGPSKVIAFACVSCGHKIKVPESYAGKKGKCPKCKQPVEVPAKKETPVPAPTPEPEPSPSSIVPCVMCGHEIAVSEVAVDGPVQCPECGSYIDPVSGGIASEADVVQGEVDEEEDYGEPDATPGPRGPAGLDRRLIMIVAGVALIVVVGIIGLIVFLKSSGPSPTERPERRREPRQVADANRQPERATPVAQPIEESAAAPAASTTHLQFAPAPGTKRTMRVRTVSTASTRGGNMDTDSTDDATFTFELEVAPPGTGRTVPVTIALTAVRQKIVDGQGATKVDYDSARPDDSDSSRGRLYGPFMNKPFTIQVSSQGQIVAADLAELFHSAAEESVRIHDERMKQRSGKVQDDRPYEQRVQERQKTYGSFLMFGGNTFNTLLGELVSALPEGPVQEGDAWDGPVPVLQVEGLSMATTYRVTAVDDDICTIQAEGRRGREDDPIVEEYDQYKVTHRLGGTYRATLRLDRRTGWLMNKEWKTSFSGQSVTKGKGVQEFDSNVQIAQEITTTVTTIE